MAQSASGFIGNAVAQAYVRAGHEVLGLTRSEKSATRLAADESRFFLSCFALSTSHLRAYIPYSVSSKVTPIIGDASDPSTWITKISNVDIVIDAAGGPSSQMDEDIYKAVHDMAKRTRSQGPPLTYIYTSGTWVNGDDRTPGNGDWKTDGSPLSEEMSIPFVSPQLPLLLNVPR
jgi:nucleoside-diphosphate-sugar epimerase